MNPRGSGEHLVLTASSTFHAIPSNLSLVFPQQNKPLPFGKYRGCRATKAREASEQKWGISSCCLYTVYAPHTDWKLVEGHNKKRLHLHSRPSSYFALTSTDIRLSNMCFPLRPRLGQAKARAKQRLLSRCRAPASSFEPPAGVSASVSGKKRHNTRQKYSYCEIFITSWQNILKNMAF